MGSNFSRCLMSGSMSTLIYYYIKIFKIIIYFKCPIEGIQTTDGPEGPFAIEKQTFSDNF